MPIESKRFLVFSRFGRNKIKLSLFLIDAVIISKLESGKYYIWVAGINLDLHPVSSNQFLIRIFSFLMPSYILLKIIWSKPNSIILHASIYIVFFLIINIYSIQLAHGFVIAFDPMGSIVIGNVDSAIVSINNMIWIFRIDPRYMMIGMNIFFGNGFKGFAAI